MLLNIKWCTLPNNSLFVFTSRLTWKILKTDKALQSYNKVTHDQSFMISRLAQCKEIFI